MLQYYAKRNRRTIWQSWNKYIYLILIIGVLYFSAGTQLSNLFAKIYINSPLYNINLYLKSKDEMVKTYNEYRIQNAELENENIKLRSAIKNSKVIDEMIERGRPDSFVVYSLGSDDSLIYREFRINAGATDGILEGAMVYDKGLSLVGKVKRVDKDSSLVTLLSGDGIESVGIIDETDDKINLLGIGGGAYTAKVKNKKVDNGIKIGQHIIYGEDTTMQVGVIVNIEKEKDEDMSTLYIRGNYKPEDKAIFFVDK